MRYVSSLLAIGFIATTLFVVVALPKSALALPVDQCKNDVCSPECKKAYLDRPGLVCLPDNGPRPWCFEKGLGIGPLGQNGASKFQPGNGLEFIGWLFFALLALTAVTALMWIVWAAVQYIYSAGNSSKQGAAKEKIWNSLYGLVLALTAILLLYTINPELTKLNLPDMPLAPTVTRDIAGCLEGKGYLLAWTNKDCSTVCPNGTSDTIDTGKMWCLCGSPPNAGGVAAPGGIATPGVNPIGAIAMQSLCTNLTGNYATAPDGTASCGRFASTFTVAESQQWCDTCTHNGGLSCTLGPSAPPTDMACK